MRNLSLPSPIDLESPPPCQCDGLPGVKAEPGGDSSNSHRLGYDFLRQRHQNAQFQGAKAKEARGRRTKADNPLRLHRGSCSGGEDDDEYVDRDNPSVPSNSIHTGAPPSSKSVVCPLRVSDSDAEDKPSSEDTQKVREETDTHPGCQPPFSLKQDDFPLLGDTVDSSVSSNDDLQSIWSGIDQSIWSGILTELDGDPGLFCSKPTPGSRTGKLTQFLSVYL